MLSDLAKYEIEFNVLVSNPMPMHKWVDLGTLNCRYTLYFGPFPTQIFVIGWDMEKTNVPSVTMHFDK